MIFGRLGLEELIGALIFIGAGIFVMWESSHYQMGTLHTMGPGYFPFMLGALLAILGVILIFERALLANPSASIPFRYRPLVFITLAVAIFAFMFERAGMVPSIFVLVLFGSLAQTRFNVLHALYVAIGLSIFSYLIFVRFLGIPLKPFWWS